MTAPFASGPGGSKCPLALPLAQQSVEDPVCPLVSTVCYAYVGYYAWVLLGWQSLGKLLQHL